MSTLFDYSQLPLPLGSSVSIQSNIRNFYIKQIVVPFSFTDAFAIPVIVESILVNSTELITADMRVRQCPKEKKIICIHNQHFKSHRLTHSINFPKIISQSKCFITYSFPLNPILFLKLSFSSIIFRQYSNSL